MSKLKFFVTIDPVATTTVTFWQNHGECHDVDPSTIQTEVFRLPSSCFVKGNGSIVNSGRWLQSYWAGQSPAHEAWHDGKILGHLFMKIRDLYVMKGGATPAPILNMNWNLSNNYDPAPEEIAKRANGYAPANVQDAQGRVVRRKGELVDDFGQLTDDGSTSSFCWVFKGSWTERGNQMARRDNTDTGLGNTPGWAWAWPQNRRILCNRASANVSGVLWDPKHQILW